MPRVAEIKIFSPTNELSSQGILTSYKNGNIASEVVRTADPPTFVEYYRQISKALSGQGDVPVSATDARTVIHLIELAKKSSELGQTLEV